MFMLAELYWQFCKTCNDEDVSGLKTFEGEGQVFTVTEAEARIYGYLSAGNEIKIAYYENVMIGFLIYQRIFDKMVVIRSCFAERFSEGLKLAKRFINALQPIPQQLIFQTRKELAPNRCLEITKDHRRLISENEFFNTWIMNWRPNGRDSENRS